MTSQRRRRARDIDLLVVLDISDVKRLGALADAVRKLRRAEARHRPPHRVGRSRRRRSCSPTSTACATGELVYDLGVRARFRDHAGDRAGALHGDPHRHRRLPLQQHDAALPRHRRRPAARGRRSRGDVRPHLRVGARRPSASARRGAGHARRRRGARARVAVDARLARSRSTMCGRKISTASSSTRARSPARGWRSSSATSATAR